jgi:hypothetical protein
LVAISEDVGCFSTEEICSKSPDGSSGGYSPCKFTSICFTQTHAFSDECFARLEADEVRCTTTQAPRENGWRHIQMWSRTLTHMLRDASFVPPFPARIDYQRSSRDLWLERQSTGRLAKNECRTNTAWHCTCMWKRHSVAKNTFDGTKMLMVESNVITGAQRRWPHRIPHVSSGRVHHVSRCSASCRWLASALSEQTDRERSLECR